MLPIRYTSPWCDSAHFLMVWRVRGELEFIVAADGVQPDDGHLFPSRQEALAWLRDNGFTSTPLTGVSR